ncbi:hypothetical protein ScPMuIL_000956 [Solemya velum]
MFDQIAVVMKDDSTSQSDLRMMTSVFCSWLVSLRSCMSAGLEDCSNYATEIQPILSGENGMCSPNGSASGKLQTMINGFSGFDINENCRSAKKKFSRCGLLEMPQTPVLVKDIQKQVEKKLHGTIGCIAKVIQDTDVSACGRKSDVLIMAILEEHIYSGEMLNVPFDYSNYVTTDGGEREKRDILRTILGF